MVSPGTVVGLGVVVAIHTAIAAVGTRFFRIHMTTRWGAAIYAAMVLPVVLFGSTLVLTGLLRIGGDLGSRETALLFVVLAPLLLGVAIDLFWMPHPEHVEVPDAEG